MPLDWLRIYDTGRCKAPERLFFSSGRWKVTLCHALTVALKHPDHGIILFDTGVAPRMVTITKHGPNRLYGAITNFDCKPELSLVSQLQRDGISPDDVRAIILSHAHADHLGGLLDFPNAEIILSAETLDSAVKARGLKAVKNAILPGLIPANLAAPSRVATGAENSEVFNTLDLFDDGTVQLVSLPGHAPGHLGMLASINHQKYFFVADACWHLIRPLRITNRRSGSCALSSMTGSKCAPA